MTSPAMSPARKTAEDIIGKRVLERAAAAVPKQTSQTNVEVSKNISANSFYKVLLDPKMAPEEKKEQCVNLLTCGETKEVNKENIKAFEEFMEFLQDARKTMALGIIHLTDTDAFSELQKSYKDMNGNLIDFDEKMKPLIDIVEAVYELRTDASGDKTVDVFKEIQEDKIREEEHKNKTKLLSGQVASIRDRMQNRVLMIAELSEKKSFFGLGGIKQEARIQISKLESQNAEDVNTLENLKKEAVSLKNEKKEMEDTGDYARRKAKLRELLDLNSETHVERQKALVSAALKFVTDASTRVQNIRGHLGLVDTQLEKLSDNTGRMSGILAITADAIKEAGEKNLKISDSYKAPEDNTEETNIARRLREEKKVTVDGHIKSLDIAGRDTTIAYADIESQTMRIKTMKDANDEQQAQARVMSSQGISGVADKLSVVLQAVSTAAIGESSAVSKARLNDMNERTNAIAGKEIMRLAMGGDEVNRGIIKAMDELATYGEIHRAATDITRASVSEMRRNLEKLRESAEEVGKDVRNAISVNADVARGEIKSPVSHRETVDNLFNQ